MESQRNIILIAFLVVCFLLWQQWNIDHAPKPPQQTTTQSQSAASKTESASGADAASQINVAGKHAAAKLITVTTDLYQLKINTYGGDIVSAKLNKIAKTINSDTPYQLLKDRKGDVYVAQSGLLGTGGTDNASGRAVYTSTKQEYTLAPGQKELIVPLTYTNAAGVTYTKEFVFKRDQYVVGVDYKVANKSAQPINVQFYGQVKESIDPQVPGAEKKGGIASMASHTYEGAAYSSDSTRYKKYSFSDVKDGNLHTTTNNGWIGMINHYFATVWVAPEAQGTNELYSRFNRSDDAAIVGYTGPQTTIAANSDATLKSEMWLGPKYQNEMAKVAPHLDLTVNYGWLWFIAQPLFKLLKLIQSFVSNWGVAIIIITLIVRGLMYPLTKAQYTSMAKMRLLQPKMAALKERFGDDRQKLSKAMMEMYKKEKVNPLGGCLPLVIQMPIFLALYWVLMGSVELRHAPFMLWIHDLSVKDPYYVLPILMGISMFIIQKMSPTTVTDPTQQKIMKFMPMIFTVFFLWFPAGLTLYWLVSNLVTITQQTIIFRQLEKKGLHSRDKKTK
ncbi:membrane protein insertase YidC [Dongshaea marina]|uniref:membrane protein insertase YidC n=1 Tax=Dongshaea marina TaxID=2047966 RepID=UPI000D3E3F0D|nr:membrane protein insertase YidC [Dongshaea marina]